MMIFKRKEAHFDSSTGFIPSESVKLTTEAIALDDVVETFERFLLACGFSFDGHLDFVEEELEIKPKRSK